jgi:hypothetical protein
LIDNNGVGVHFGDGGNEIVRSSGQEIARDSDIAIIVVGKDQDWETETSDMVSMDFKEPNSPAILHLFALQLGGHVVQLGWLVLATDGLQQELVLLTCLHVHSDELFRGSVAHEECRLGSAELEREEVQDGGRIGFLENPGNLDAFFQEGVEIARDSDIAIIVVGKDQDW